MSIFLPEIPQSFTTVPIHGTGKAFAGGKGFRGLCRLLAAKQTGKTGKGNGKICPF